MDTRLRRDVVWNLVPVALLGGVGLGINFLIAGWWGAAALGVFNLVTIAFFVFAVLGAWGIQFSVLRGIAAYPDEIPAVVVGALVPNIALATLVTIGWLVFRAPIADLQGSDAVAEGMLWATPGLFCFAVNKVLFGIVNGHRRMRAFAVYTSLRYLLLGTGLVLAKLIDLDGDELPAIWSFTECTLILVMVVELVLTVKLRAAAGWTRWAREHLHYGARAASR
jgi:O-antigen/teichoic acid export membrane protein